MPRRILSLFCALCIVAMCMTVPKAADAARISEVVRVAFTADNPPYQYFDGEEYVGLNIDLFNAIADAIGFEAEYFPMESVEECKEALEEQMCDVILGLPEQSMEGFAMMDEPLSTSTISMLIGKNMYDQLKGGSTGLITLIVYANETIPSLTLFNKIATSSAYSKSINRICVSSQANAFEYYLSGKAEAMMGDRQSILYFIQQNQLEDEHLIYYNQISDVTYTLFVRDKDADMLSDIELGLLQIRNNGVYSTIRDKWSRSVEGDDDITLMGILKVYWPYAVACLSVIMMVIVTIVLINRFLRKQVAKKTTELRSANEALEQRIERSQYESNLRSLMIERNPGGILLFDSDGHVTQCNRAASRLFGVERNAVAWKLYDSPLGRLIMEGKTPLFEHAQKFLDCELVYGVENCERTYQYSLIPLKEDKQIIGAMLIINDITAMLQEARNIAEAEKNRILNLMVAAIAHEIRNPLMVIKSSAQLLEIRKDRQSAIIEEFSRLIPNEVDRINHLVEDLISYIKKSPVHRQKIDLREIFEFCIHFLNPTIHKPYIEIRSCIDDELMVMGNADQFKQIFINILLNAAQAMEVKAHASPGCILHLDINAYKKGDIVRIEIRDEGCGMDADTINQVTNPFYTTKRSGIGLGMAVTKKYVEENHGRIEFASEQGEYTLVTLEF